MAQYSVRCDNVEVGVVTAPDKELAVDLAYLLRKWSPKEVLTLHKLPDSEGPAMHVLIDTTNGRALARHESYRALCALHYIQFANVDAVIIRCGQTRTYAVLSEQQAASCLRYAGVNNIPVEYGERIRQLREVVENADWLLLPFTVEQLDQQAFAIDPNNDRPLAFNPHGDKPVMVQTWSAEPQVNRKRIDSAFWVNFAAGEPSGQSRPSALPEASPSATVRGRNSPPTSQQEDSSMTTEKATKSAAKKTTPAKKAVAKKSAPAKKAAAKSAPAPAKKSTTTAPVDERNGIKRPSGDGNTAQVWNACDAVQAKKGAPPTFKEVDEYIEKKNPNIPTATRRSNYAVWRKYHGISGRVS